METFLLIVLVTVAVWYFMTRKERNQAKAEKESESAVAREFVPATPDAAVRLSMEIVQRKVTPHDQSLTLAVLGAFQVDAHILIVDAAFSEVALAQIKQLKLNDFVVVTAPHILTERGKELINPVPVFNFTVGDFIDKRREISFDTIFAARAGMRELEANFKILKGALHVSEAPAVRTVEI